MSWQSYVDKLIESKHVTKAALFGHDGKLWASSPELNVSSGEVAALVKAFSESYTAQREGVRIGGTPYIVIRAYDDLIFLKKENSEGATIAKTKKGIIVALYGKDTQPGQNSRTVHKIASFLRENDC